MEHPETLHLFLPEPAYDLWVKGELREILGVPDDGTRVEIIGGEIVVSPCPRSGHNVIVSRLQAVFAVAAANTAAFPWQILQMTDLNLAGIGDGYIPDLLCVTADLFEDLGAIDLPHLLPDQVALAVEVTSPSNAAEDRKPGPRRERMTKWSGYAREGIPYYLLIDRDPKVAKVTLHSDPDRGTGRYRASTSWPFGEPIKLSDPFNIEIPTEKWQPWTK